MIVFGSGVVKIMYEKSMSCFTIPSIVSKMKIYQLVKPGLEKGANELEFCM